MVKQQSQTYLIPVVHLEGTLAEMLFADAAYFLLAIKGETNTQAERFVETTTEELQSLTGLTRKTIRKQLDRLLALAPPYQFIEEEGVMANGRLLKQPHYQELARRHHIQKPLSFMHNEWGWVLAQPLPAQSKASRFPYAILNIMLRKPNGRFAPFKELQKRIQKRGARKLPDPMQVRKALAYLQNLNLIEEKGESYLLRKAQFGQNGRQKYERSFVASIEQVTHVWQWAIEEAPERARLAQEIVTLGQFDEQRYGKEIFYDLAQIRPETDLVWLKYAVHRHRHRPQAKDRWQKCWQLFQNSLTRQRYGSQSEKLKLKFYPQDNHLVQLRLPNHQPAELRWGKLVVWVRDGRFQATGMGRPETILVQLQQREKVLWERTVSYEDSVVRLDLTAVLSQTTAPIFQFQAKALKPLKQFSLDVLIEAEYITPPENNNAD